MTARDTCANDRPLFYDRNLRDSFFVFWYGCTSFAHPLTLLTKLFTVSMRPSLERVVVSVGRFRYDHLSVLKLNLHRHPPPRGDPPQRMTATSSPSPSCAVYKIQNDSPKLLQLLHQLQCVLYHQRPPHRCACYERLVRQSRH